MSSVIRDAGEKDNKTHLSTTDNGPFFIIKKYIYIYIKVQISCKIK